MLCQIEECGRERYARGWCKMHYYRARKHGDPLVNKNDKGGIRKHFMYGAWAGMINRCHNPNNSSFPRYGGVGVKVCDRWRYGEDGEPGFTLFLRDMGERPDGMTLDRIDAAGDYEPGNCRWATATQQRRNLSAAGDRRGRKASSEKAKARWAEWRETNDYRKELTFPQQSALLALDGAPRLWPQDQRWRSTVRSLIGLGFAADDGEAVAITDAGREWIAGRRVKAARYSPDHLRKAAEVLEIGTIRRM